MFKVCKTCKHLITDDPHVCPSPEYVKARNHLVSQAARAEVTEDEEDEVFRKYGKDTAE